MVSSERISWSHIASQRWTTNHSRSSRSELLGLSQSSWELWLSKGPTDSSWSRQRLWLRRWAPYRLMSKSWICAMRVNSSARYLQYQLLLKLHILVQRFAYHLLSHWPSLQLISMFQEFVVLLNTSFKLHPDLKTRIMPHLTQLLKKSAFRSMTKMILEIKTSFLLLRFLTIQSSSRNLSPSKLMSVLCLSLNRLSRYRILSTLSAAKLK